MLLYSDEGLTLKVSAVFCSPRWLGYYPDQLPVYNESLVATLPNVSNQLSYFRYFIYKLFSTKTHTSAYLPLTGGFTCDGVHFAI